mmetsp:Transcript_10716/g.35413  ORF Transcript_10716/g.35413 Transcript_10716/m.35413 type:complete len:312 (+) Transcript_10716:793-1728(+)
MALRFWKSTCLASAKETADFTSPSISAPLKFLVRFAMSVMSTSVPRNSFSLILALWIFKIWCRPGSSGSPISMCTSNRPGLKIASSSMSRLFVIPMSRMLFRESTPSILVNSWFTIESCTPVPLDVDPLALHTASISSKMMMCSSLSSPFSFCSASASAKSARMFSSLCPTYLLITSGPLHIFGSRPLSILPICRAINVLPVPGGPCRSMPFTCWMPNRFTTLWGNTRLENARRKISSNCLSNPPIPSFSKEKSLVLNKLLFTVVCFWLPILIPLPCGASNTNFVSGVIDPRIDVTPKAAPSTSMLLTVTR